MAEPKLMRFAQIRPLGTSFRTPGVQGEGGDNNWYFRWQNWRVGFIEGNICVFEFGRADTNHLDLSLNDIVSVLGRDEGYTVKYNPLPEEVPDGKAGGNTWRQKIIFDRIFRIES